jgi:hypothetical protein
MTNQLEEPIMRKAVFAIAVALAVAGAGFIAGSMGASEPAEAKCSSRC